MSRCADTKLQLDDKGAIAARLPMGSGEIESAHRFVIQQQLKRAGSWWRVEKAEAMLALRVLLLMTPADNP